MSNENRDFLDELVTAEQAPPTTDAEEADQGETQEQPQTVEQVQEPETPATEATTAPDKDPQTVPYAAMKAEREKRQRLERELAEERAKHQAPQNPPPNYYEDPEGYLARAQSEIEQRNTARLYAALEAQAKEQYSDYDEKFGIVMEHAAGNPAIVQEIMTAPNPAIAAYKMGQKLSEFQQMQDPEAYRAKIVAEIRAQIDAENRAKAEQRQRAASEIPPDLSQARNTRGEFAPKSDVFNELFKG